MGRQRGRVPLTWAAPISDWTVGLVGQSRSPQTVDAYRTRISMLARLHPDGPWDLTEADLLGWITSPPAAATKIAYRTAARSFYQWAHKAGRIAVDPSVDLPKAKTPQPRPRPVPNDIYQQVLAAAPDDRLRVALRLAGELGMRRGEVAALHRDHLHLDDDGWWLRFVGKGDKERTIPCPGSIATELRALIDSTPGDYAFPHTQGSYVDPTKHLTAHWLGTRISRLLPDGYTMHKLRHRAGTEAYKRAGHDIYLASKLLGHSSVAMTQVYVAPDLDRMRAVVDDIAGSSQTMSHHHRCTQCGQAFRTPGGLARHHTRTHARPDLRVVADATS